MDREIDLSELTNDRIFQDLALLLDRKEILGELSILRESVESREKITLKGISYANYLRNDSSTAVRNLLGQYKYPPGFFNAVTAAIWKNKVSDKDVERCYFTFYISESIEQLPIYAKSKEVVISVYPYLLKNRKKLIMKEIAELLKLTSKHLIKLPSGHILNTRPHPKIRFLREWYWKRQNDCSTKDIVDGFNKRQESEKTYVDDDNIIDQAISSYKELLERPVF